MTDSAQSQDAQARIAELESELGKKCVQFAAAQTRIAELDAELKNERAQFALAERAVGVGYWRLTLPDYRITWSPGMRSMFGMDPTTSMSSDGIAITEADIDQHRFFQNKIETAVETRTFLPYRRCFRGVDGSERFFDTYGDVEIGPDGEIVAIVGACHDVTQRVSIEAERNKAEELQRIVMEAASDIITVHDAQGGNMEFASAALGRLLGRTTDIGGHDLIGLIHPDDIAEVMEHRKKAAPGKITTTTYRMRDIDGRYVWFESTLCLVCEEATGEVRHVVAVMRDVSERKAAELEMQAAHAAAEAANKAKSSFLANMSHELRTPLNAVIGFTDVMCHETFGPIENLRYREYVSLIHNSGQHLLDLINDVLDMAKIESGKFELRLGDLNLAESIAECIQLMGERAATAGVAVTASLPLQGLICEADSRAVKQILLNLLSNAIKFTPTGGHVDITATIEGDVVRIQIRDDGIGIAAEDLPRLAKPFVQVCDNPNLAKKGTGLGLALVRALTEQHGGHLTIESPAQDGTIVTVEFPRLAMNREAAA